MFRFIKFGAMRLGSFFVTNAIALLLLYELDAGVYGVWASYVVPVEYVFTILVSAMLIIFSDKNGSFGPSHARNAQVRDLSFLFLITFLLFFFNLLTEWWSIYCLSVLFLLYSERISALLFVTKNELVAQVAVKIVYPGLVAVFLVPILFSGKGPEVLIDVAYVFLYSAITTSVLSLLFFCRYAIEATHDADLTFDGGGELKTQNDNFGDWVPKIFFTASMALLPVFPVLYLTAHDGGAYIHYYKRVEVFGGLVCIVYALLLTFITPRLGRARSSAALRRYLSRLLPTLRFGTILVGMGLLLVWMISFNFDLLALIYLASLIINVSFGPNFFVMMFLSGGGKTGAIVMGSILCAVLLGILAFPISQWTPIFLFSIATMIANIFCCFFLLLRFRIRTDIFLR